MKGKLTLLLIVLTSLPLFGLNLPAVTAQPPIIERLAVQSRRDQLALYSVDALGNPTLLGVLDGFSSLGSSGMGDDWVIDLPSDIVIAPDRRSLAFTAYHWPEAHVRETALFLFTVGQAEPHRVESPGIGRLFWSPEGDALLLAPHDIFTSYTLPHVENVHLYSLATDRFTQVLELRSGFPGEYSWLPGGQFVYAFPRDDWETASTRFTDLFIVDSSGQDRRLLADLEQLIPQETQIAPTYACLPRQLHWSTPEQRLYYVASCLLDEDFVSALFSVGPHGDNRLEFDLRTYYPDDFYSDFQTVTINPDGHIDALVNASLGPPLFNLWRVLSNRSGQWEVLVDEHSYPEAFEYSQRADAMQFSADGQRIAVGSAGPLNGYVTVIDLATGSVSTWELDYLRVRSIQWQSEDAVSYNASTLNLTTGEIAPFVQGLEGTVWVLP